MSLRNLSGVILFAVLSVAPTLPGLAQEVAPAGAAPAPLNPYTPPACTGIFPDVPCPGGFAVNWIERFYNDGITAGCGGGDYCPNAPVTRAQMAVFVEEAMHGTGSWTPGDLGNGNTGLGANSLPYGASGDDNTGVGLYSLISDSTGYDNTGLGALSLYSNSGGDDNTAVGSHSQYSTTGTGNTAVGYYSLASNTTGTYNTAIGYTAAVQSANLNDATAIGAFAIVDASYHVRIGDSQITQIGGQVGWSNLSDARAKTDITGLDLGLDFVMALHPVSFTMKQGNGRTDMGFVAQDVEALVGDNYNVLGVGGDKDRTLSLRYTDFIAPMVKAIQEQQGQIAARDSRIARLEDELRDLRVQVQALLAAQRQGNASTQP